MELQSTYTYDDGGKLITVRYYTDETKEKIRCVIDYGYDESGTLLRHTYTDYVVCDDYGTPLKDDIITYTVDYTYGTYYCYTPEE